MMAPLHLAHLDPVVPQNSLECFQNLDGYFALQAHAYISSIERHGTQHAHQTTVAATLIAKLLHLSSPKS
jgi:hypothetical protein